MEVTISKSYQLAISDLALAFHSSRFKVGKKMSNTTTALTLALEEHPHRIKGNCCAK